LADTYEEPDQPDVQEYQSRIASIIKPLPPKPARNSETSSFRSGLGFGFSHERAERVGVMDEHPMRAFLGLRHVQPDTQLGR
jgi:hypothetical protein